MSKLEVDTIDTKTGTNSLTIKQNDTSAITIDTSQNVGIGTTSPNGILELKSTGNTNFFITAGNTSASQVVLGDTDDIDVGKIAYSHNGNTMEFIVNASERMRIDSSGDTSIGVTSVYDGSRLSVEKQGKVASFFTTSTFTQDIINIGNKNGGYSSRPFRFWNGNPEGSGSIVGEVVCSTTATSYNTSSDHRLKENVIDLADATTRVKQLQPKRFNFIADADTTVDGFLAHEVSSVVPEAISGTHNEVEVWKEGEELPEGVFVGDNKLDDEGNTIPVYQGIDQSKLVPLLTASLKEAIAKIEELETRIATLENA